MKKIIDKLKAAWLKCRDKVHMIYTLLRALLDKISGHKEK